MKHEENSSTLSTKEKIFFLAGGIVLATTIVVLGRKIIKQGVTNAEENKSYQEDNSASYAKEIKMAFDNDGWWGTDTKALRETLQKIPTKAIFKQVIKSYHKLYSKNLMQDMADELQSSEYQEMLAILSVKPDTILNTKDYSKQFSEWAKRLKAAFDKYYGILPGTDEMAIKAVFNEMVTQNDFTNTSKAYQQLYSNTLLEDLKSELEFWEYNNYMNIIYSKPKT